jgi:CRP/FNR family cyclic AMP-dependent transcriptional regulator
MLNTELTHAFTLAGLSKQLDEKSLELLTSYNRICTFAAGETILKQGKKSEGIYIIIEGMVTINSRIMGAGTAEVEQLGPGNFLGEISFIENCACATSVVATKNVKCLFLNAIYLQLINATFPEIKYKIMLAITKQLSTRFRDMHDKTISYISNADMTKRSFFSEIFHSLKNPAEIPVEQAKIDVEQLRLSFYFNSFDDSELKELIEIASYLEAEKYCTVINANAADPSCYIVIHGAVQVSMQHDNKSAKLSVIGPGILFACASLIDEKSRFAVSFVTCERAILLKLTKEKLDYLKQNNPTLWYKLFNLICRSFVVLEKSIDKLDIRLHTEIYNR